MLEELQWMQMKMIKLNVILNKLYKYLILLSTLFNKIKNIKHCKSIKIIF